MSCHCFYGWRKYCSRRSGKFLMIPESQLRGGALELQRSGGGLLIPGFPEEQRVERPPPPSHSFHALKVIPGGLALIPLLWPFLW